MKSGKRRKFDGPVENINVVVAASTKEKLLRMAGTRTMVSTLERLVDRAYVRYENRATTNK